MTERYRVAIVGCGGMGQSHAESWRATPRAELVAVADVNEEAAQRLGEAQQLAAYGDYTAMLREQRPDIVSITTWQNVRSEITIAAAQAGVKGILGEKPMAGSLGEADDMLAACEAAGAKLAIGHQRRFSARNVEARRLIRVGAIGTPQAMLRRDGEGLLNRGTHEIDEMRFILGDPLPLWVMGQVARETDRWERRVRCEDRCMGLICFEGGVRGVYESDLPEPGLRGDSVYGSEGQLKRGEEGTLLLLNSQAAGWQSIRPPAIETDQFRELVEWLDGSIEEHRSSGCQARVTMEIMMAIYESLRVRDVVRMPLQTRSNPLDLLVEDGTLPVKLPGRYDIRAPFPEQSQT
jgi:UDP-N-acetyl-2-amino-2-deoxyglucuronate dehydrogenase